VSVAFIAIGLVGLIARHRASRMGDRPPTYPQAATWGALGAAWMTRPIDEPWANVGARSGAEDEDATGDVDDATPPAADSETGPAADEPGPTRSR